MLPLLPPPRKKIHNNFKYLVSKNVWVHFYKEYRNKKGSLRTSNDARIHLVRIVLRTCGARFCVVMATKAHLGNFDDSAAC